MLIFSNTICFKTVSAFADQTIWIALMGPSLCMMAICMFAAIRCPFEKDEKPKPQTQPYYQPNAQQGTQFQNIDKQQNPYQAPPEQNTKQGHGLDI